MIKSIKLKFTSTDRKSMTRIQRSLFSCNFRRLFLSKIKFFTWSFRIVKICFDSFISDVKKCFDSFFVFFSCVKSRLNSFRERFLRRYRFLRHCRSLRRYFVFRNRFCIFFHSRNCSRRLFFQNQNRWRRRFF